MLPVVWWVAPMAAWFTLTLFCACLANLDELDAEPLAAAMFVAGSLACASAALGIRLATT